MCLKISKSKNLISPDMGACAHRREQNIKGEFENAIERRSFKKVMDAEGEDFLFID